MIKVFYVNPDVTFGFIGKKYNSWTLNIESNTHNVFFYYFRACSGLTEAAYQLIHNEVYAEWCCDKCLSSKNIPLVKFKP